MLEPHWRPLHARALHAGSVLETGAGYLCGGLVLEYSAKAVRSVNFVLEQKLWSDLLLNWYTGAHCWSAIQAPLQRPTTLLCVHDFA